MHHDTPVHLCIVPVLEDTLAYLPRGEMFKGEDIVPHRSTFPDHTLNPVQVDSQQVNSPLATFTPATADEVRKIIMSSPNKSCDLDPLPTTLLKACLDKLLYPLTNIVNASLCSGLFPDNFKQVQVNPVLKKSTLPKQI